MKRSVPKTIGSDLYKIPLQTIYQNRQKMIFCEIDLRMYEVAPSILESRLLGSNNIVDAAVVGIPDKENGQVSTVVIYL
jgi:hypothetical protein